MEIEILDWIQEWFDGNCDGNWEQNEGIQITTLGHPGWEVEIDLSNTSLVNLEVKGVFNENGKHDWYGVKIENQRFKASGDPGKLKFLLGLFKQMIEQVDK